MEIVVVICDNYVVEHMGKYNILIRGDLDIE
jgi:hypothetical protein